ncbi:MAG: cobyric acid synthase CobQ, partial [Candidatus Thermoplasmatota archaeon]|nr:cobyric acid synthase CobQ [Candidatus Thermoplasmatota archaeon]
TDVCIIKYPMMENLSEVDPLKAFGIGYNYVNKNNKNLLKLAKIIILPGSKDVFSDLKYLKDSGIDDILRERAVSGVKILGICGGYQMLSRKIESDLRNEEHGKVSGLGLLNVEFSYFPVKTLKRTNFTIYESNDDPKSQGYEIHFGNVIKNSERALFYTDEGPEGSISESGNVLGTNVHGCLESTAFIEYLLNIHIDKPYGERLTEEIDRISEIIGHSIDLKLLTGYLSPVKK